MTGWTWGTGVLNVLAQLLLGNQIKIANAVRDNIGTDIVFSGWQLVGWCTPHVTARDKPGPVARLLPDRPFLERHTACRTAAK